MDKKIKIIEKLMNFFLGFGFKVLFIGLRKFNFYIKCIKFICDWIILFSVKWRKVY